MWGSLPLGRGRRPTVGSAAKLDETPFFCSKCLLASLGPVGKPLTTTRDLFLFELSTMCAAVKGYCWPN